MPTPVSTARQCLTPEAAHALDEAVAVARRRGHSQTTSLHAVSALLSIPSSVLRDACARARNTAYSPRLQFKALELCLNVSLDRVPAGQQSEDPPPVSNSLMAAIKRSQANQRRQPENFHLYHQLSQQQSSTSISCIKVELQNLILSLLDDPVVSRVFGESGFRSSEIKLAIVRPLPQVFKFSRFKGPPMFLYNLSDNSDPGSGRRGFSFPFSGFTTGFFSGDENCRRIGEVLLRNKGRNPLLVGVCAYDTLASFSEIIERRKENILPVELCGISLIGMESDIIKFVSGNFDKGCLDMKFDEVGRFLKQNQGPGLVVNLGDLKVFVNGENDNDDNNTDNGNRFNDSVSHVIEKLTRLLQLCGRKVWLIGSTESYESYLKLVNRFPSIEKDWDLQLLPITSFRSSMAESYPRSSLMESFVPFGGLFSTPSELNSSISSSYHCLPRCHLCNEKCEQEILAVSKGELIASIADQYQSNLPSWLQMTEIGANKGLDMKTRDDGVVLSAKIAGLQKKWDSTCQRLHHTRSPGSKTRFSTVVGFQPVKDGMEDPETCTGNSIITPLDGSRSMNVAFDLDKISSKQSGVPSSVASAANTDCVEQWRNPSKEDHLSAGLRSHSFSNSSMAEGSGASPTSATSMTTDLGLRISPTSASDKPKKLGDSRHMELSQAAPCSYPANGYVANGSMHQAHSSPSSSLDFGAQCDSTSFKMLFRDLIEKIGEQDEAVRVISQTIADCRAKNDRRHGSSLRGDIWFNFAGPDKCGKKKIAAALAEIIFGSKENLISADLSPEDGTVLHNTHSQEACVYDVMFRGKTIVDYLAGELMKKPLAVVFLENVDKADVQAQKSLSNAIRTGKFSDSHGREIGINNTIFVTTSTCSDHKNLASTRNLSSYSEERILRVKSHQIEMLIEQSSPGKMSHNLNLSVTMRKEVSGFVNKRKLVGANQSLEQHVTCEVVKRAHKASARNLDLNLPAEETDVQVVEDGNSDNDSMSSNSQAWLQDFVDQLDRIVVFKPFDFDALGEKILTEINNSFHEIIGSECSLEIDLKVMDQILAAAYLSNRKRLVEEWVEQVLGKGFVEVQKRYNLNAHSIVKLVVTKGLCSDEHMAGIRLLPSKIILN